MEELQQSMEELANFEFSLDTANLAKDALTRANKMESIPSYTPVFDLDLGQVCDIYNQFQAASVKSEGRVQRQKDHFGLLLIEPKSTSETKNLTLTLEENESEEIAVSSSPSYSEVIDLLHVVKERILQADKEKSFLEKVLFGDDVSPNDLSDPKPLSEAKLLINNVVQASYKAGRSRDVGSARAQLTANSEAQAKRLAPIIDEIKQAGAKSLRDIARVLNVREIYTKNGNEWDASSIRLLLQKIDSIKQRKTGVTR